MRDEQQARSYDYSDREDVLHAEIMLPENAPEWAKDRETLWNAVDQRERHVRAQFARSVVIGLPRELNLEQNKALLRDFLHTHFVSKGVVADFAIHDKEASDGGRNPHAHVLVGMRGFDETTKDGWAKRKNRELNGYDPQKTHDKNGRFIPQQQRFFSMDDWRDAWEEMQNIHLASAGSIATVSLKSYAERGVDQLPTIHLGYEAWELERQGVATSRGDYNRSIEEENERRRAKLQAATANDNQIQPALRTHGASATHKSSQDKAVEPDTPKSPADALKRRQNQDATFWGKQRRWMADTMDGWQRYWDKQTEWFKQRYTVFDSRAAFTKLKGAFSRDNTPEQEPAKREEEEKQKPRRVWSAEQRADYRMLHPYLQRQTDLSKTERAHAQAVIMQYAQQKRDLERRVAMERIASQQVAFRQRAITQDRPLPHQTGERTRTRGR